MVSAGDQPGHQVGALRGLAKPSDPDTDFLEPNGRVGCPQESRGHSGGTWSDRHQEPKSKSPEASELSPQCDSVFDLPPGYTQASALGSAWPCVCMSAQSCLTLCGPMDCSPTVTSVHRIARQEYWSGLPFPTPGDLPDPWIETVSLVSPALADGFFTTGAIWEAWP